MKPSEAHPLLARAERIGIVRTDRLGDVVLTLPLARALKEQFPSAEIAFIAHSSAAPLIEGLRVVDRCFFIDQVPLEELFHMERFDALFFPRARADEAWDAWRARVPLRIGTAYRWWSVLYNVPIYEHRRQAIFHEAEYNVRMLEKITQRRYVVGLVPPSISDSARASVKTILRQEGWDDNEPFIVVHPGGSGSSPLWMQFPAVVALVRTMLPDYRIVVTGTAAETALCTDVASASGGVINLCNRTSLDQLIALLDSAAAVVANSTGVLHIAAALGRPVVGIYPADPPALSAARWGPLTHHRRVLAASPISHISPREVAGAIYDVITSKTPGKRSYS